MNAKMVLFGLLAVAGLGGTLYFNVQHALAGGSLADFVKDGFANPAASSLTLDLTVGALAWVVFMIVEARRIGMRWWAYFLLTFFVAFAFACPLFFLMRERRLRELDASPPPATA